MNDHTLEVLLQRIGDELMDARASLSNNDYSDTAWEIHLFESDACPWIFLVADEVPLAQ